MSEYVWESAILLERLLEIAEPLATDRQRRLFGCALFRLTKLSHEQVCCEALDVAEVSASLNQTIGSEGDGELGDLFADPSAEDPAEEAGDAVRRAEVRKALQILPERERRILELRFGFDGQQMALEAIGKELGITRERVRQLEGQALAKLAAKLGDAVAAGAGELAEAA